MNIYLYRDNQHLGPYSAENIREMLAQGQVVATEAALEEGSQKWRTVEDFIGLAEPLIHINQDGQQLGPYTLEQINAEMANGNLQITAFAFCEGMAEWAAVSEISGVVIPAPLQKKPLASNIKSADSVTKSVASRKHNKNDKGKKSRAVNAVGIAAVVLFVVGIILWFFVFRSAPPPPAPRSKDDIMRDIATLPVLYLTEKTQRRVTAPDDKKNFVDEETGEICWRARACHNPDCPGKASGGQPYLFISPNLAVFLKPDGTLGFDLEKAAKAGNNPTIGACPECLKKRNLGIESKVTKKKYADWVKPYTPPESEKRKKELLREHAAAGN